MWIPHQIPGRTSIYRYVCANGGHRDSSGSRLSQAISDRMGHPVQVRIMEIKDSEPMTAAALERQQAHRNRSEAEKAIREDPTVRALQDQMGAQLVEDSIQPLQ